jgi:phosphoribosyl 1,2-cyclic phosphate phosphodiesterase
MEAIVLGTAAAEGIPALFCGCHNCRAARAAGGKEIRARTALFVEPDLCIDFGPDALYALHRFGLDWSKLTTILVTHSHCDHIVPQNLEFAGGVFARERAGRLNVYGNEHVRKYIQQVLKTEENEWFAVHPAFPMHPFDIPGGRAVAIRSHHQSEEHSYNYLLTRDGRTLLYACDTGYYDEETLDYLKGFSINYLLIECTYGLARSEGGHLGLPNVVEIRDRLAAQGSLAPDAVVTITHISHNAILPYDEMAAEAAKHGMGLAYDGMRFSV